jgi:hypothetical protein
MRGRGSAAGGRNPIRDVPSVGGFHWFLGREDRTGFFSVSGRGRFEMNTWFELLRLFSYLEVW